MDAPVERHCLPSRKAGKGNGPVRSRMEVHLPASASTDGVLIPDGCSSKVYARRLTRMEARGHSPPCDIGVLRPKGVALHFWRVHA